ncbi:MAG: valine--tRNA ligase [Frankiaceae bacterium]
MTAPPAERNDLPSQYDAGLVEADIYAGWERSGYFLADVASRKPAYSIVIPPPNVNGSLHIGHAFEHTLIDAIIRRKRMAGFEALWLPGMDHAGISMQNVVERHLGTEGISRHDLGRAAFVERVWEYKANYGGAILRQMRRLGSSVDWSRERFTMDAGLSRAVRTMFGRMYADGLIYRAERIINWCPRCMTALSDIEVEHSDDEGELVSIRYGPLTVATTRVETMLGDTAVAVHPDDERYAHLIGTEVELPLTGRRIPVVADDAVDPAFGTGAVKVTPAHDPNDFAIGQRHGLATPSVINERGVIIASGPFQGLDRYEARPAITAALRELGLIVAEKRPYLHAVGHCDRCKTVVEPRLSKQWFVAVAPLAKAAGDAVRDGRTTLHPPEMRDRYFAWVDNMHDWCISRQLWWGHRIPVWYCSDGHVTVPGDADQPDPLTCGTCGLDGLRQDDDVLDTWFSSGLWPFSTLGWPAETEDLARFYPTSALVVGYDIIFFWVARMMMFGTYALPDVPFRDVLLHGLVRDSRGKKMSKSWGNVVDPLEWVDRYGADALRFTLARGANPGGDVPVSEEWVQGARNFTNKLWNATRFALLNGASTTEPLPAPEELDPESDWILSRLQTVVAEVDGYYEAYEFGRVCETLFHFAWDELCDWYLELAKLPLANPDLAPRTRAVLGHVFDVLLRLLHPVMPFVTETLWRQLTGGESVMVAEWPVADPSYAHRGAEEAIAELQDVVTAVRRFRSDQRVKPSATLPAVAVGGSVPFPAQVAALARLAGLGSAEQLPPGWSPVVAGRVSLGVDLSGVIDLAAERARLAKDRAAAVKERESASAKLTNAQFVGKAPAAVIDKTKARLGAAEADLARIADQLAALRSE